MPKKSRTSRTIIGLLVVLIVLLIRGTRRQRRLFRLLTGFTFRYPGEDAVNSIGGFFGSIGSNVKDYVTNVVRTVADALQSGIDWVLSIARSAGSLALSLWRQAVDSAWSFAQSAWSQASDLAHGLFDAARSLASSLFDTAMRFGHSVLDSAWSFAQSVWAQATSFASSLFDTAMRFGHSVLDSAWSFAQSVWAQASSLAYGLFDTARGLIDAANTAIHDTFFSVVNGVRDEIAAVTSPVNDYLFGTVQTIIDVITTVLDWLVGLASFPFTTARDMWAAMRQSGGATVLGRSPDFVGRWGEHVLGNARTYVATDRQDYELPSLGGVIGGGGSGGGGTVGPGVGTPDRLVFAAGLLDALGAPSTSSNVAFLVAWMTHENTRASFNPLATTLDYGNNTKFNPTGVRNYADLHTGIEATARTLTGSDYPSIVAALRAGDGHAAGQAHRDLSRWSGGGYDTINV